MRFIKSFIPIAGTCTLLLSGCSLNDDDKRTPPKNQPDDTVPTAQAGSFSTQADTPISDSLMATDPDANPNDLIYAVESEPSQGTLMLNADGAFTYTPNATVTGMDQFTFTVSDDSGMSEVATVDITIDPLQVSFSEFSLRAFNQMPTDEPLPVNGRVFEQDVTEVTAYDDLLMATAQQ